MSFGVLNRAATSVASGIVVIALTSALAAPSGSSTIAGLVRDATGAPIPDASITGERRPPRRGVQPAESRELQHPRIHARRRGRRRDLERTAGAHRTARREVDV